MAEIAQEEFEKDIKELETRLKVLRAEYNQYFAGTLHAPPHFTIAQIRKLIRKYAMAKSLKGIQRFQYYNLVARFNTMMEFYGRREREKEAGILRSYGYVSKDRLNSLLGKAKAREETRQALLPSDPGYIISDVRRQKTSLRHLYETWNTLSEQLPSSARKLDYDTFRTMIQRKTEQIKQSRNCRAVRYKITLSGGKVKIKARPVK